ncbi:MAG: hypothetical protein LBR28_00120 [Bacteroidales bacterium]|nr:hypothetical protein [Bacteroidales bacterium]
MRAASRQTQAICALAIIRMTGKTFPANYTCLILANEQNYCCCSNLPVLLNNNYTEYYI